MCLLFFIDVRGILKKKNARRFKKRLLCSIKDLFVHRGSKWWFLNSLSQDIATIVATFRPLTVGPHQTIVWTSCVSLLYVVYHSCMYLFIKFLKDKNF